MVKGMKTVKMSCTESKMLDAVEADRSEELKFLRVDSVCWSAMTFLASVSTILMASVMVAAHSGIEVVQLRKMFNRLYPVGYLLVWQPCFTWQCCND
jgi:hypothetical protein